MSLGSILVVLKLEALCAHTLKRVWLPEPDGDSEQSPLARRDAQLIGSLTTRYLAVCLRGRETEQHGRVRLTEMRMRPMAMSRLRAHESVGLQVDPVPRSSRRAIYTTSVNGVESQDWICQLTLLRDNGALGPKHCSSETASSRSRSAWSLHP